MRCSLLTRCLVVLMAASCAAPAAAGWNEFWHRVKVDYHRNHYWPEPFLYADRDSVHSAWRTMEGMGWQRHNTLGDAHFNAESHALNEAGLLKLRSILKDSPPQRRAVFVLRTESSEQTAIRLDSVQQQLGRLQPYGELPFVAHTDVEPVGRPGDFINRVERRYEAAQPAPVLPAMQAAGGIGAAN